MLFKLANMFMRGVSFLGADTEQAAKDVADQVSNAINTILTPVLLILSAAGIVWAIVLGVNMARADSTEKREEAKKRLISLIVGLVIMVALIVFFKWGLPGILDAFLDTKVEEGFGGNAAIKAILKI